MSDFSKFRTAVSGFNRTDVVNYIESTSIEHQKALRKLTDERDKLAAEMRAFRSNWQVCRSVWSRHRRTTTRFPGR